MFWWTSFKKVQNALRSGWDLQYILTPFIEDRSHSPGLLDLPILCGQSDCADALAIAGVRLREVSLDFLQLACRGESFDLGGLDLRSASEFKSAASAAAHASLKRSFTPEGVEKGVAVYQTLKFQPRGVPMALVHHILGFALDHANQRLHFSEDA